MEQLESRVFLSVDYPTGLVATPFGLTGNDVKLTWIDNSNNESGFKIERKQGTSGSWSQIATVSANSQAYTDPASLSDGTQFYYRVRAYSSSEDSGYSNDADAVTWRYTNLGGGSGGTASFSDPTWTITSTSNFTYSYRLLRGDGEMIAKVASVNCSVGGAKTGIMFRESTADNSKLMWLMVTPTNGLELVAVSVTGGSWNMQTWSGISAPIWMKIVRQGNRLLAYTAPGTDAAGSQNWVKRGQQDIVLPPDLLVGMADNGPYGALNTSTFTDVQVTPAPNPLPTGWFAQDIGPSPTEGESVFVNNGWKFSIEGSGQAIGGTLDAFQYAYKSFTGDGEIIARVASVEPITGLARAGVMIREGLQPDARNVFMGITDGGRARYQYRSTSGGDTSYTETGTGYSAPYYVKVVRNGNNFSGWVSSDGTSWTQIGSTVSIAMSSKLYVGMALSAAAYGTLNNSTFDNVKIQPSTAPTNLTVTPVHAKRIDLSWTDNALGEDGFVVERRLSTSTNWATIGVATGASYSDEDPQIDPNSTYVYQVRAFVDAGVEGAPDGYSGYSGTASASTVNKGDGLAANYFNSFDVLATPVTGLSQSINHFWGSTSPTSGIDPYTYQVDWKGQIKVDTGGTYTFYTYSDDGVRLWVNDELVVDNWTVHEPTENSDTVSLSAGTNNIRLEYYQNYGSATMQLSYSGPGTPKQVIPTSALFSTGNTSSAPSAPTGLGGTAVAGQINLGWTAPPAGASHYAVYRSTTGVTYTFLGWSSGNSYADSDVSVATTYYYKVLAGGAGGRSTLSSAATATAVGNSGFSPSIQGTTNASSGNLYQLTLKDNDTSANLFSRWFVDWGDGQTQTVDGKVANAADKIVNHVFHTPASEGITFRITAIAYTNGVAYNAGVQNVMIDLPTAVPAAPTNLSATQTSASTVEVVWAGDLPGTTNRASSYLVERSTNGTNWATAGTVSQGSFSFTDQHAFQSGTTYYYRVTALNDVGGASASTNTAQFTLGTPSAPTGVSVLSTGAHTLRISWADNSNNEKGFTVYARPGTSGSFLPIVTTPPNRNFASIPDADPSTQYQVNVVANGAMGHSDSTASSNASGTTTAAGSSDETTEYKVKLISDDSLNGDLTIGNADYRNTTGKITWESDAIDGEGNPTWIAAESWEDAIYRSVFDAVFKVTDAGPYSYSWKDLLYVASGTSTAFQLEEDHPSETGDDDKKTYYLAIEDRYQHGSDEDYNDGYFTFEVTKRVVCGDCEQAASEALGTDSQSTPSLPALSGGSGLTPAPVVTNNPAVAGSGSQSPTFPTLRRVEDSIILRNPSGSTRFFGENGASYRTAYDYKESLATGANSTLVMTRPDGSSYTFYDFSSGTPGQFKTYQDSAGNVTSVAGRDGSNRITDIEHTVLGGTAVEGYHYTYGTGADADRVVAVSFRRKPDAATAWNDAQHLVRKVEYAYTPAGDLKLAELKDKNSNLIDGSYFRYYGFGETNGYNHMAKLAFGPQSLARLKAAFPTDWDTRSDADVKPYADAYYEYDRSGRVTLKTSQGEGCSSCSGGLGTYKYEFTSKNNDLDDLNAWVSKTVEYLPDATSSDWTDNDRNIHYYNSAGRSILDIFHETTTGNEWITYRRYDADGREILTAQPSAVSGYDEAKPDLLNNVNGNYVYLRDTQGLIETTEYFDATTATSTLAGGAAGYFARSFVQQGELGTGVLQSSVNYFKQTDANGNSIYPVAASTVYGNENGTDARTTRYQYSFDASHPLQITSQTTIQPPVTTDQNGRATSVTDTANADTSVDAFDAYGRITWSKNADGYINYTDYDDTTGAVIKQIVDVVYSQLSGAEQTSFGTTGWSQPSGGLHLTTTYEVDTQGRVTKTTDPKGNLTYTVYNDANHEIRAYRGFDGTNTTGPIQISREDRPGSYRETLTLAAAPHLTNGVPDGTESIAAADIRSLTRSYVSAGGQLDHTDSYFSVSGLTYGTGTNLGTLGTHFLRSSYAYDQRGRQSRVQTPDGTITRTLYDGLNRVTSTWKGTDDEPTSGTWSPSNTAGTNLLKISENVYDNGGLGDSNLTQSKNFFGSNTADFYVGAYQYDYRNRMIQSRGADNVATKYTLNNLGEATTTQTYADANQDFVLATWELRGKSQSFYDPQGRFFRTIQHEVNPTSGAVGNRLTSNVWYNARGMQAKSSAPNGLFSKTAFDGAGRPVASYTSYDSSETSYADALTVSSDTVIEQVKRIYDAASNVVTSTTYSRLDGVTTDPGELGAATNKAYIQTAVSWYDKANRPIASANYGRDDGGTRYVFNTSGNLIDSDADGIPDEAENSPRDPNSSDDYIVSKVEYDDAGRAFRTADNKALVSQTEYDLLGRTVKTIANVPGTNTAAIETDTDQRQTTEYIYDSAGRLSKQRAWNPKGSGNGLEKQDTAYLYESPIDGSWVTNTVYPDSTDNKVITLSRSGSTATATLNGHGYAVNDVIYISGSDQSEYNGRFVITAVTTNTFDFTVSGSPATPATGYITVVHIGNDQAKNDYDRLGRVLTSTDQRGVVHTYNYDSAGRLSSDAVTTLPSGVDGSIRRIDYAYDDLSRRQTVTSYDATGTNAAVVNQVKWTYNGWGMVSKSQQSHSGAVTSTTAAVKYAYEDGAGADKEAKYVRLASMAYPSGRIVYYNYPTSGVGSYLNRVDNIANDSAGSTKYAQYTYLGSGTLTKVSHPGVTGGLNLSYGSAGTYAGWDRFGRVLGQEWKNDAGTSTKDGYVYTYDRNSNRTSKDVTSTSAPSNLDETYGHDGLDRLIGFQRGTLSGTNITTSTFTQDWSTLDSLGNWRTFQQDSDGAGGGANLSQDRTSNAANETGTISGSGTDWIDPVYDAAGNMTSGPKAGAETTRLHYVYDAWNRLVIVKNDNAGNPGTTLATYVYDGLGRRVSKVTGGNTDDSYYNENWQLLDVRRNGDVDAREQYVWDLRYIDAPVVRMRDTNTDGFVDETLYYTNDANMNVTGLVDTAGTVQERYVYEPYGKVSFYNGSWTSLGSSAKSNSILYTGSQLDAETGLYNKRNRQTYHPTLGTWGQRDSAGYIDGPNLYQYVGAAPATFVDPTGNSRNGFADQQAQKMWRNTQANTPARKSSQPQQCPTSPFTGGTPQGSTGGFESTWEATKNLYNWMNWKWGSSNDRIRIGANDYYARLIRQETQFAKDREFFLGDVKKKVDAWILENGFKDGQERIAHTAVFKQTIYSTDKSSANPHNWFTGQLTLGRFDLRMQGIAEINVKFDGTNRLTGKVSVRIDYDVNDPFDPLGDSDPKVFRNVIKWSETEITATVDCRCGGGGGGKRAYPYPFARFPF